MSSEGTKKERHSREMEVGGALVLKKKDKREKSRSLSSASPEVRALTQSSPTDSLESTEENGKETTELKKSIQRKSLSLKDVKTSSNMNMAIEAMQKVEEETKKIKGLEEWQKLHQKQLESINQQIKQAQEQYLKDKKFNEEGEREKKEVLERLERTTEELNALKREMNLPLTDNNNNNGGSLTGSQGSSDNESEDGESPNNSRRNSLNSVDGGRRRTGSGSGAALSGSSTPTSSSPSSSTDSIKPAKIVRSWNKKMVGSMQNLELQVEKEKEAVRQLEQYKTQSEEQYKQMKIKVREEVDSRIKLEEDLKRLQKEIAQLGITV